MAEKEKRKRKLPKRNDVFNPDKTLNCATCDEEIKPELSTYQKCKCLVLVFCSQGCKKASDHSKSCKPFTPDFSGTEPTHEMRQQLKAAMFVNLKLKLDSMDGFADLLNPKGGPFSKEIEIVLDAVTTETGNLVIVSGLGGLVASRCSHQLLEIIQDKPGVGLSKDAWGFKELHQIQERLKETKDTILVPVYLRDILFLCGYCYEQTEDQPKYRTQFDRFVNPESPLNDLKRIVEGPGEIDLSDHALIRCIHSKEQGFVANDLCRTCFVQGYERTRAVASGAFMFSYEGAHRVPNGGDLFCSVIYQAETSDGLEMKEDIYFLYPPDDALVALKYLSLHSADVDPRMICMNPDLYWTLIWSYGSITKALEAAGGQKLYDIGFGKHEVHTQVNNSPQSQMHLSSSLIKGHFVSKFANKDMEMRYCCANPGCFKFEDTEKFLGCGGCSKIAKRRYCSNDCYEKDCWHREHCQGIKEHKEKEESNIQIKESQGAEACIRNQGVEEEEVNNNQTKESQGAWKQGQQKKKKGKGKKIF